LALGFFESLERGQFSEIVWLCAGPHRTQCKV